MSSVDVNVYFWVEDVTAFVRELIRFFRIMHPANQTYYEEKYDRLDKVMDRTIDLYDRLREIGLVIYIFTGKNYYDYVAEEYGTDVNIDLMFDSAGLGDRYLLIAEIVNWILRTSDTDLAIETEGGALTFKRMKGRIYYRQESGLGPDEYIPVRDLDFDREAAFEFTKDDEWVFFSEETIRERERWRQEREKQKKPD